MSPYRETAAGSGTFLVDHLGSVVQMVRGTSTVNSYDYDAFGRVISSKEGMANELKFTGSPLDRSGLYHMGARFYNPNLGRFITQDTYKGSVWEPWTQNLYVYVGNNPVNYVDPTGHEAIEAQQCEGGDPSACSVSTVQEVPLDDGSKVVVYNDGRTVVYDKDGNPLANQFIYAQPGVRVVSGWIVAKSIDAAVAALLDLATGGTHRAVRVAVDLSGAVAVDQTIGKALDVPEFGQVDVLIWDTVSATPNGVGSCDYVQIQRDIRFFRDGSYTVGP